MPDQVVESSSSEISNTQAYRELTRSKKRLVVPSAVFLLVFLLILPALTSFTSVLNTEIVPGLNWAIVYAYGVFLAPVVFAHLYSSRARRFDELVERARREAREESERS